MSRRPGCLTGVAEADHLDATPARGLALIADPLTNGHRRHRAVRVAHNGRPAPVRHRYGGRPAPQFQPPVHALLWTTAFSIYRHHRRRKRRAEMRKQRQSTGSQSHQRPRYRRCPFAAVHCGFHKKFDEHGRETGAMITTCMLGACSHVPHPGIIGQHEADGSCAKPGHVGVLQHGVRHPNIEAATLNPRVRGSSPWRRTTTEQAV